MCILAHPDDESLGTGGILARYATEGVTTFLVTATRGERGWQGDPFVEVCARARDACAWVHVDGEFGLWPPLLVSFGDVETTNDVIAAIQADGTCWCGGTIWQGQTAMRISVSSWATTDADVERSLEAMIRIAGR